MGKWRPDPVPPARQLPYRKPTPPPSAPRRLPRPAPDDLPEPRTSVLSSHELSQLARAVAASRSGSVEMLAAANVQLGEWDVTRLLAATHRAAVYYLTADRLGARDDISQPEALEALIVKLAAALPPQTALTREQLLMAIDIITALNAGRRVNSHVTPFAAACDMLAVCACVLSSSRRPLQALPSVLAGAPFPVPDVAAPG